MKKTDIALLIIIISISALLAYLSTNALMGNPKERTEEVPVMEPISTEVMPPDPNVFYDGAINPSVRVEIDGESSLNEGESVDDEAFYQVEE